MNGTELVNMTQETFRQSFGNDVIFGIIFIAILGIAVLKNGLHSGVAVVVLIPIVLAMAFSGYLPQPLAFITLIIAGMLVFYVIREWIGGGYR